MLGRHSTGLKRSGTTPRTQQAMSCCGSSPTGFAACSELPTTSRPAWVVRQNHGGAAWRANATECDRRCRKAPPPCRRNHRDRSRPIQIGLSIGATLASPTETADEVLARADSAMYRAKAAEPGGFRGRGLIAKPPGPATPCRAHDPRAPASVAEPRAERLGLKGGQDRTLLHPFIPPIEAFAAHLLSWLQLPPPWLARSTA